jgi:hypothetical protein
MTLSKSVEESLKDAEQNLRNALAFAARQEKPYIAKHISKMICDIDNLIATDELMDRLENRMEGESGRWGPFGE